MLGNLTLFFAFIVNFISFVLLGLLFQQIIKILSIIMCKHSSRVEEC